MPTEGHETSCCHHTATIPQLLNPEGAGGGTLVYDYNFKGGGVVDGEGVAVKDSWSGGWGVIKGSFQNILKQGVSKGKSCS